MYEVIKQYSTEYILELIKSGKKSVELHGFNVKVSSERLKNFSKNGVKCATCNCTGVHFNLERPMKSNQQTPHLNLYSKNGIMLTADHDILKSDGGKDHSDNYNVLCQRCNKERGNKFKRFIDFYNYKVLKDVPDGYVSGRQKKKNKKIIKESKLDNHVDDYYKELKTRSIVQEHVRLYYEKLKKEKNMLDKYQNEISVKSTRNISKFDGSTSTINMILLNDGVKISSVLRVMDESKELFYPVKILAIDSNGDVIVRKFAWCKREYDELGIEADIELIDKIWHTAKPENKFVY